MKKTITLLFFPPRKWPLLLIAISSAILFTFILYGCRKNDFPTAPPTHEANFVQQFFSLKHPVNDTAAYIIAKLKAENDRTGFVNELPANCGLPVWDKLLLKAQNNHPAFTAGGDDDTTIVIPLTNTNASLSGVLVAQPVADSLSIKCYTNNWLYNICHAASIDTNYANESLAFFMYMENQSFGTQTFYHIPAALIADGPALPDNNGAKTVTIAGVTPPTEGFIINTVCIEITCPPSIAIGCMPKTVCTSVPGDGAPAGGGDGTPGGGNTGSGGGQSGGGSGGNGNGPGGSTTCPLTTNVTWYGLMPPPDPCGTPTPVPDSVPVNPILAILHNDQLVIKHKRDSVWALGLSRQWEYAFDIGINNNTGQLTVLGLRTDSLKDEVDRYKFPYIGYTIVGDYHIHEDPSPKDRHAHDPQDLAISNLNSGHNQIQYYRSYVDCGDTLYVVVNENLSLIKNYTYNHIFKRIMNNPEWQALGTSSERRKDGIALLLNLLGSSSISGFGVYKSINADKTNFVKIN